MRQLFLKPVTKIVLPAIVIVAAVVGLAAMSARNSEAKPVEAAGGAQPFVVATVLDVNCVSAATFTNAYKKITDFGTFTVQGPDSLVDVTFNGRIGVDTLTSANGAIFELRVDNLPTGQGRARATLRSGEVGGTTGIPVSIKGIFSGLAAGTHTVSMWVRAGSSGSGTGGRVDPGCWSTDHVVVMEYKPGWGSYLPAVFRN